MLTIVDIRAVGPGTWNSWKRQLIPNCMKRRRNGCGSAMSSTGARRAHRREEGRRRRRGWARGKDAGRGARQAAGRCLLDRRAGRHHRDEPASSHGAKGKPLDVAHANTMPRAGRRW
jgi:UTP:GlnB (protein PII) uridylyltransferase